MPRRLRQTMKGSFFGDFIYSQVIPEDHFLMQVTSIKPTLGGVAGNTQMPDLVKHDTKLGIPAETYAAGRGYDDGDLHEMLKDLGKHSALKLQDYRTQKRDPNKEPWLKLQADPFYRAGLRLRYRIERKFGEAKAWHRFGRCRYRGLDRFKIQS